MSLGSDAERIAAIQELEQAIAAREPNRTAALAEIEQADQTVSALQKPIWDISSQIRMLPFLPVQRYAVVCINGKNLDRGDLAIGNETLKFEGWHGTLEVPLMSIASFEIGKSNLPPRSGVPLLGRIWPGDAKPAESLLIGLSEKGGDPDCQVVLADLKDGAAARKAIEEHIAKYSDVKVQRDKLEAQKSLVQDSLNKAVQVANQARAKLKSTEDEIAPFRKKRDELYQQQRQADADSVRAAFYARNAAKPQPTVQSQTKTVAQKNSSTQQRKK